MKLVRVLTYEGDPGWIADMKLKRWITFQQEVPKGTMREISMVELTGDAEIQLVITQKEAANG